MRVTLTSPAHVVVEGTCASCHRLLDLECAGLQGFYGYQTYNEYFVRSAASRGMRGHRARSCRFNRAADRVGQRPFTRVD